MVDAALRAVERLMPWIRAVHPDAQLHVVGRAPVPELTAIDGRSGVRVWGEVPDVRPFLAGASVMLVPLTIARGVQNKVLEGMAMARPVVASPQALQGLGRRDDLPVLVAETPQQWAERLAELLTQPGRCRQLGESGRAYVERYHGWEACLTALDRLLEASAAPVRADDAA